MESNRMEAKLIQLVPDEALRRQFADLLSLPTEAERKAYLKKAKAQLETQSVEEQAAFREAFLNFQQLLKENIEDLHERVVAAKKKKAA
ncbi:MAG: hypothetical protein H7Z75_10745 [Ferruginibacter sp.]|nr:hypothetical protein [Cytophagales bacterium]